MEYERDDRRRWYEEYSFQKTVTLADGMVLDGTGSLDNEHVPNLWLNLDKGDLTMTKLMRIFSDSNKTSSISIAYDFQTTRTFNGYTELTLVKTNEATSGWRVRLSKPVEAA